MHKTQIINYKNEHSHSVAASIVFMGGANACSEPNSGLAHLVEHMLFRACGNLSQDELYKKIECNGITINATTSDNAISVYFQCLPDKMTIASEIVAGMLTATWDKNMLDLERKVVEAEIRNSETKFIMSLKNRYLNADSTKNIVGTKSSLARISFKKLLEARKTLLGGQKYFIVAGKYNESDLQPLITILNKMDAEVATFGSSVPNYKNLSFERGNYNYISLSFIFNKDDISQEKLELLKAVMFDGMGAPASILLREKKGYTYSVDSDLIYSGTRGLLNVYMEIENFDDVISAIRDLFDLIKNYDQCITDDVFAQAKPFYTSTLNYLYDDNVNLVDECESSLTVKNRIFDIENEKSMYEKIVLSDLLAIAEKIFMKSEKCLEIVCKNTSKIKKFSAEIKELLAIR